MLDQHVFCHMEIKDIRMALTALGMLNFRTSNTEIDPIVCLNVESREWL